MQRYILDTPGWLLALDAMALGYMLPQIVTVFMPIAG
jgi:hypothetical protein